MQTTGPAALLAAVIATSAWSGCCLGALPGGEEIARVSAPEPTPAASAPVVAPPTASEVVPVPSTAPTSCRLEPPGGVVVARDRARPEVIVGASSVMVRHQPLRTTGYCRLHSAATSFALPLTTAAPGREHGGGACGRADFPEERMGSSGRLERIAGEPVFLACAADDDPVTGRWCLARFHGPSLAGFPSFEDFYESHVTDSALGMDLAVGDGFYFVAADLGAGSVKGTRHVAGETEEPRERVIGSTPSGGEEHGVRIEIAENTRERTVVYYGAHDSETAYRVVMGADGTREGAPERTTWPAAEAPVFRVVEERESRGTPPVVRLVRADGQAVPIAGLDDAAAPFSPAVVEIRGARVLVFAEGLNEATRIWGAFLDVERAAITSRFRISEGELEGGYVHADAMDGTAVVAWGQHEGETRVIRAAQLACD